MSPSNGTLRWISVLLLVINPPRTTVWPLMALTVVCAIGGVDARRADDLAGGRDGDGNAFGFGPHLRLLGVDLP